MKNEIVWLSQSRIKDRKTIMKHIQNIYKDNELVESSFNISKFFYLFIEVVFI